MNHINKILKILKKNVESAEIKFLELLELNKNSDYKKAGKIRLIAYNETIIADKKLESLKKYIKKIR